MHPCDPLLLSPAYLDAMYAEFCADPSSVDPEWAELFRASEQSEVERARPPAAPGFTPNHVARSGLPVYGLVQTFRTFGHLIADIDPLGRSERHHPYLELEQFGFEQADQDRLVQCPSYRGFQGRTTLRETIEALRETYCGPLGVEYVELPDKAERDWLEERMEPARNRPKLSRQEKLEVLRNLIAADTFEETLQRLYPGSKRFSLEGGTTLITLLQTLVQESLEYRVNDIVIGMAHRGRLNVMTHVMEKPLEYILAEFEGRPMASEVQGYGDVKYHLGYSADYGSYGRKVHLSMAFNPSHLETVNPVVEGICRAKQSNLGEHGKERVVPVLIHGDAAFAGQGVVAETLTLAGLEGYATGGTVHVIVNNQIGFTAEPHESRSTRYPTEIAKLAGAPIFHVNADHPELVVLVTRLALAFRQKFAKDVVIDLVCFRRHGHNEQDDASFTQPLMAGLIDGHDAVSRIYAHKLGLAGVVQADRVRAYEDEYKHRMREAQRTARRMPEQVTQIFGGRWTGLGPAGEDWSAETAVPREQLEAIARALLVVPEGFHWHRRLEKLMRKRVAQVLEDRVVDWGCGEALAIGSLLLEDRRVRLSGQDAGRGTFSHRHAIYTDMQSGERYIPLDHVAGEQACFEVINSPLSEEAVLGFEYGYSTSDPWQLVIWEAQFGDFANGAQIIIDQLIASAEYKWGRMSGLVMLLPHGQEGQGPEHSSARLERFLELCGESNLQICNLTTPAQFFHALRRQLHRAFRKPLVVMAPKSLLRHPLAVSPLEDFEQGGFEPVLDDPDLDEDAAAGVTRVLLCSGKIFYPLLEARREKDRTDVAIVRLEQLYPYPMEAMRACLARYPGIKELVWVQEEPRNMGAWRNLSHRFRRSVGPDVPAVYAGRDSRAVPASGSLAQHKREEGELVEAVFGEDFRQFVVRREDFVATSVGSGR